MSDTATAPDLASYTARRDSIAALMQAASAHAATGAGWAATARHLQDQGHDPALIQEAMAALADEPPEKPVRNPRPAKSDGRSKTSAENGKQGGRPPAPPPASIANDFAATIRDPAGLLTVRYWRGAWYQFAPVTGWLEISEDELAGRVCTFMRSRPDYRPHARAGAIASVLLNLRAHDLAGIPEGIDRPIWLDTMRPAANIVAFANGHAVDLWRYASALAVKSTPPPDCFYQASPALFSSDFVAYPWQPDHFPDKFHRYLSRIQPDAETVRAIARMLGLLLVDCARYETFWQFYGTGCNGKTVLLDVITALVGKANVSSVPLNGLIEDFQTWPLGYSKVNICGELATDIGHGQYHRIEGEFKNAVSGGAYTAARKGKDVYQARYRARFVVSANSLPTFVDRSEGIWRRLRIIPFPEHITDAEKDANLATKIIASDMPGIVAWALDGLAEVIAAGNVPDCPAGAALKAKHRQTCDHEREYLAEHYEQGGAEDRIKGADMYEAYRAWMEAQGYRPLGAAKFFARVEEQFAPAKHAMMRVNMEPCRGVDYVRQKALQV